MRKEPSEADHIFTRDGGWFFFDKDGSAIGPYSTEQTATEKFRDYLLYLNAH